MCICIQLMCMQPIDCGHEIIKGRNSAFQAALTKKL